MDHSFFDRTLTALDHARLQGILSRQHDLLHLPQAAASALAELLDAAEIVPSQKVPGNVATMRSHVLLRDERTGEDLAVTLRYPGDAEAQGVNVFTPIGLALLGSKVGSVLAWQGVDGVQVRAQFKDMLYQPEAAGDWLD